MLHEVAQIGPSAPVSVEFDLAILSKKGGRSYNEDACGHWNSDHMLCCAVADGAGGHGGGDIASKFAVQYLLQACAVQGMPQSASLHQLLHSANRHLRAQRVPDSIQENMHTTVVTLCIDLEQNLAVWGHVGDSRLYVFRQGVLQTRTKDHSLVQSLLDAKLIAPEQAKAHAQRSELLCALGSEEHDLLVNVSEQAWHIAAGDVFLLCTDGLWEYAEDAELERLLKNSNEPKAWLASLEQLVLKNAAAKPYHDNFSALTVWANPVS